MRRNRVMVAVCGLVLMAGTPAWAQTAETPPKSVNVPPLRTAPTPARSGRGTSAAPVPSTRVLGVPVTADAPVSPPYDGTAYKTLGGQAETGQDDISGQVMQPTGAGQPK